MLKFVSATTTDMGTYRLTLYTNVQLLRRGDNYVLYISYSQILQSGKSVALAKKARVSSILLQRTAQQTDMKIKNRTRVSHGTPEVNISVDPKVR